MDTRSWLKAAQLTLDVAQVREAQQALWGILEEAKKRSLPATPSALNGLYQYKVPKLSADGTCSLHEELDAKPYELSTALGGRSVQTSFALMTLDALTEWVHRESRADWVGVYQARAVPGGRALVKLAYRGKPSRPEFPLTEDFARRSTNVAVALDGRARVVDDVRAHADAGGGYYECDPAVRAEACLPLLDANGKVVGVVDAESTQRGFFVGLPLSLVAALATEAAAHLPR